MTDPVSQYSDYDRMVIAALNSFYDMGNGIDDTEIAAGKKRTFEDILRAQVGDDLSLDRTPQTDKEKSWLAAMPYIDFKDMVDAIAHRDQATVYEKLVEKRREADAKEAERQRDRRRIETRAVQEIEGAKRSLGIGIASLIADKEKAVKTAPRKSLLANLAAWWNGTSDPITAHYAAADAKRKKDIAQLIKIRKSIPVTRRELATRLDSEDRMIAHGGESLRHAERLIEIEKSTLDDITKKLSARARLYDGNPVFADTRRKAALGQDITEQEWDCYSEGCRLFATLTAIAKRGMNALIPSRWSHEDISDDLHAGNSRRFLMAIDKQMPDDLWALDRARKRLKATATSSTSTSGSRGGRERSRSYDVENDIRKRLEQELKEERAREEKAEQARQMSELQQQQMLNLRLAEELFRLAREAEERNAIDRQNDYSRGRSRGLSR